jgi:hypothetical protein
MIIPAGADRTSQRVGVSPDGWGSMPRPSGRAALGGDGFAMVRLLGVAAWAPPRASSSVRAGEGECVFADFLGPDREREVFGT